MAGIIQSQKRNLYSEQLKYYQANSAAIEAALKKEIRSVYYQLWYLQDRQHLFNTLDSIYRSLNDAAILRVKTGDRPGLDSIAANVRVKDLQAQLKQNNMDIQIQQQILMQLLNTTERILPVNIPLEKLPLASLIIDTAHPANGAAKEKYRYCQCRYFRYEKRKQT